MRSPSELSRVKYLAQHEGQKKKKRSELLPIIIMLGMYIIIASVARAQPA